MTATPPLFPPGTNMTGYVIGAAWVVVVGVVIFLTRKRIAAFLLRKTRADVPDEERLRNFRKGIVFVSAFAVDMGIMGLVSYLTPPAWTFPVMGVGIAIAVICSLSFAYLLQSSGLKLFGWPGRKYRASRSIGDLRRSRPVRRSRRTAADPAEHSVAAPTPVWFGRGWLDLVQARRKAM